MLGISGSQVNASLEQRVQPTQASSPRHNTQGKVVGRAGEQTAAKCAAWRVHGLHWRMP